MLPSCLIKLYGEMSVVDAVWFLSEGRGTLVQASCLAIIGCMYSLKMWAGRRGFALTTQTSCPLRHSGMDTTEMWYRKAQSEEAESILSEIHLQLRFMLCIWV